ncbi:1967_t:CDS:2 [Gigaspora rosea]|nr:1967_t:CDS:2 [Gigaspora rosea]
MERINETNKSRIRKAKPVAYKPYQEFAKRNPKENKAKDRAIGTEKEETMKQHKSADMDFNDDKYKRHRKETAGLDCRYENGTGKKAHEMKNPIPPIT